MRKKKQKEKKAMFSQRLAAFLIDIFFVALITSVITSFIPVNDTTEKLYDEETKVMEKYVEQKIKMEEYVNQLIDISYDISRQTVGISIVSIVLALIFYVIYPFYHNGQTIGKQILKIKVKRTDEKELTMNDLLFRSMINHNILSDIIIICLVLFVSKDVYFTSSSVVSFIQYVIIFISFILVAFTKKRQGLHDMLVHTEVVCIEPIKIEEEENVVCEN